MAAASAFVFDGIPQSAYWIYQEIKTAIREQREPDREKFQFTLSADYENETWQHIVDCIEDYARDLTVSYRRILDYAKEGIVQCALNGTLDSDMNTLDMKEMVNIGVGEEEEKENQSVESKHKL